MHMEEKYVFICTVIKILCSAPHRDQELFLFGMPYVPSVLIPMLRRHSIPICCVNQLLLLLLQIYL